jgi:prolyl-tRNA editing enzyme YbaK/EbsC (Cys-tRNA(Pro) deacylase)
MDLENYLKENNIWHNFIEKPETIHTADASNVSGVDLNRLTKSLILLDQDHNPILVIIPGIAN